MRRFIAGSIVVAAMLFLAACSKGEPEKKLPGFGFREYSVDPEDESKRRLVEEFENLGTETTRKQYDEKEKLSELEKKYFDGTGEHLLKTVCWRDDFPTRSEEYDMQGRLVLIQEKYEDGFDPYAFDDGLVHRLTMPSEYRYQNPVLRGLDYSFSWLMSNYTVDPSIRELRTEIVYKGDTDEIESIRTVTETGETVGVMEFGEEDTVLSVLLTGDAKRFEENYDANSRTGTWKYTDSAASEWHKEAFGEMEYDSSGRFIRYTLNEADGRYFERSFEYEDGGYWEIERWGDDRQSNDISHRYYYDYEYEDEVTLYEWYTKGMNGNVYREMTCLIERDENGAEIAQTYKYYDESGNETNESREEYAYYEDGNESRYLRYRFEDAWDENGEMKPQKKRYLFFERTTVTSEKTGLGETVQTIEKAYSYGECDTIQEKQEVFLPDLYDRKVTLETCSWKYQDADRRELDYVFSEVDNDGRIRKIWEQEYKTEVDFNSEVTTKVMAIRCKQYNGQGLLCEDRTVDLESGQEKVREITVWEHWEQ